MRKNMKKNKLTIKLNRRIAELENENKKLIIQLRKYEAIIDEAAKAKEKYEESLKACRELSATYIAEIQKARQAKRDFADTMEREIANFRKHSRMLLKDADK